jgi:hypothetical protein
VSYTPYGYWGLAGDDGHERAVAGLLLDYLEEDAMQFLITGVDAPGFGSKKRLHRTHQRYMDTWADALVARGPSLSSDGRRHTGSVHVIELPDLVTARRFADEEPYAQAGWYTTLTITRIVPCTDGTMWERPAPATDGISALITIGIADHGTAAELAWGLQQLLGADADGWIYAGVMCDSIGIATGVIALLDEQPSAARNDVSTILARAGIAISHVEASRWRRGGRGMRPGKRGRRSARS